MRGEERREVDRRGTGRRQRAEKDKRWTVTAKNIYIIF